MEKNKRTTECASRGEEECSFFLWVRLRLRVMRSLYVVVVATGRALIQFWIIGGIRS